MWSPSRLAGLLAAAFVLFAAGCQIRPVYAPGPSGASPQSALPAIAVEAPATRIEQVFRNALLFGLRGGGDGAPPAYALGFRMLVVEQPLAIEPVTGTPAAYQILGSVAFIVRDSGTGAVLFEDRTTSVASFNRSSQNFANIRARRDAEDRLADSLARLVETRLAAFFATR